MKSKVIIRRCNDYDPDRIAGIVREGMEELGVRPRGRVLFKPNLVLAHKDIFPHAFTRREFLEGVIKAVADRAEGVTEMVLGERSGITIPTRFNAVNAGYHPVLKRYGVKKRYFDEVSQVPVALDGPGSLRREIFLPRPVVECDFLINLPKFKAHPWTRMTLSLKNFIGIQDDRHRLLDHNSFLEHKIVDLNQAVRPGFIAIDAIIAGQKMMLTPTPFELGAIVMGLNPVAVDAVGCRMVNLEPESVIHVKMAAERGLGPIDPDDIELGGDFPLEEIQAKTRNFEFCLERIDDYFNETSNLTCTVGAFPEAHSPDYCWGGCPGALQEAMHIFKGFYPDAYTAMGKVHYVVGRVEGPLELDGDEKVIFAGGCTSWRGRLNGREVVIEPSYQAAAAADARKTKTNDMLVKTAQAIARALKGRSRGYIHSPSCPVSVAEHVNYLSALSGLKNPNFDRRLILGVNAAYWQMRAIRAWRRVFGSS